MLLTPAAIESARIGVSTRFRGAYDAANPGDIAPLVMEVPSGATAEMLYDFLLNIPGFRRWVGDRVIQNIAAEAYSVRNEPYELTIGVKTEHIRRDTLGTYNGFIDMMAQEARNWPYDLATDLMLRAEAVRCFDGQYFFDTDHPTSLLGASDAVQANLFALPLTRENYLTVRATMRTYRGENGRTLRVNPNALVVGPQLEARAKEILQTERINGEVNPAYNTATLIVINELADYPNDWYVADTSKPLKPFLFQTEVSPTFEMSDHSFDRREILYGGEAWGAAGLALWFLMAKSRG